MTSHDTPLITERKAQKARWRQCQLPADTILDSLKEPSTTDRRCSLRNFLSLLESTINVTHKIDFHTIVITSLAKQAPSITCSQRQHAAIRLQAMIKATSETLKVNNTSQDASKTHFIDHPQLFDQLIRLIISLIIQQHGSGKGNQQKHYIFRPIPEHEIKNMKELMSFFTLDIEEYIEECDFHPPHLLESIAELFMSFGSLFADIFLCTAVEAEPENENSLNYEPPRPSPYQRKRKKKEKSKRLF